MTRANRRGMKKCIIVGVHTDDRTLRGCSMLQSLRNYAPFVPGLGEKHHQWHRCHSTWRAVASGI